MDEHGLTSSAVRDNYAIEILKIETFKTHGVSEKQAIEYLNTPEGRLYRVKLIEANLQAIQAGKIDAEKITEYAINHLTSGRELPRMEIINEPLVKVTPRGEGITPYTPFFGKPSEFESLIAKGHYINDGFGLPLRSEAPVYDIVQITPKGPTEVFVSTVAPTSELGGQVTRAGGATQYLVPNRALFTDPVRVTSIGNDLALHNELVVGKGLGASIAPVTAEVGARSAAGLAAERSLSTTAARSLGVAGTVAFTAYDGITATHRAIDLHNRGNIVGSQSEILEFAGRNVGLLGGAALGVEAGAVLGIESGPGALLTGAAGGVIGAIGGQHIVTAVENHRIYNQDDKAGNSWAYDPQQPALGWTRTVSTRDPDASRLNEGFPVYLEQTLTANPALTHELNYKASGIAVQMALAHPPTPQDPYSIAPGPSDTPSIRESPWTRDAQTQAWSRSVTTGVMEHGMVNAHTETASPQKTAELLHASDTVMAQNLASSSRAIAARYQAAYEQYGWDQFGAPQAAVTEALKASPDKLQASDGHDYTRGADGQWTTPGLIYGTNAAEGNLRAELDAARYQQRALHSENSRVDRAQEAHRQQETQGRTPVRHAAVPSVAAPVPIMRAPEREAAAARHAPNPAQPQPEVHQPAAPAHSPTAAAADPNHAALAAQQAHQQAMHAQRQAKEQQERRQDERAAAPAHPLASPEHGAYAAAAVAPAAAAHSEPDRREPAQGSVPLRQAQEKPHAASPAAPAPTQHAAPPDFAHAPTLSPPLDPLALRDFRHAAHPLNARYEMFRDALGEQGFHQDRPTLNEAPAVRGYSADQKDRLAAGFTAQVGIDRRYSFEIQNFRKDGDVLLATEHPRRLGASPLMLAIPEAQSLARSPEQHAAAWRAKELPQPRAVDTARTDPRSLAPEHPGHPDHPRNPMFEHARSALTDEYARWGIQKGAESLDRETLQVMIGARANQLDDVGAIRLHKPNPNSPGIGEHPKLAVYATPESPNQKFVPHMAVIESQTLQHAPPVAQSALQFTEVDKDITQMIQTNRELQAHANQHGLQGPTLGGPQGPVLG